MFSVISFEQIKKIPAGSYLSKREVFNYKKILLNKKKGWIAARFGIKKEVRSFLKNNYGKDVSFKKIEIVRRNFQKPICKQFFQINKKINISLSHCGDVACVAVAGNKTDGIVGCDIERIRKFEYNILMDFLTEKEFKTIIHAEPRIKPFLATLFWSLKESYLKALGTGLVYHPKFVQIRLSPKNNEYQLYDKGRKVHAKIEWSIYKKKYILTKVNVF